MPGTLRLALAATLIAAAGIALSHRDPAGRWAAAVAGVCAAVLLAWWRGLFVTEALGRRLRMLVQPPSSRLSSGETVRTGVDAVVTVALELEAPDRAGPEGGGDALLGLLAGYLDRYGVSCSSIRVVAAEGSDTRQKLWASLTLSAAENLAALRARSASIPLRELAETLRRRVADHLRELGWQARAADSLDGLVLDSAEEGWGSVADERGHIAAYQVVVDEDLPTTVQAVRSIATTERRTVFELAGPWSAPQLAVLCALRTSDKPAARAPLAGLVPCSGEQLKALRAMDLLSTGFRGSERADVTADLLSAVPLR